MLNKGNYFDELKEYILNKSKWSSDCFTVFDSEAGTGKTLCVQEYCAESVMSHSTQILFVKKFAKDNELVKTVEAINAHAGREIAGWIASNNKSEWETNKKLPVLCITHSMYKQICIGNHKDFINGRDILIIDEFPDILESVNVTKNDICELWGEVYPVGGGKLAEDLLNILLALPEKYGKGEMGIINFLNEEYDSLRVMLNNVLKNCNGEHDKKLLEKFQILLSKSVVYSDLSFYTTKEDINLVKLKNNIILDANGGFDYRYKLAGNIFKVVNQEKYYDYSDSTMYHYKIKTGKKNLKNYSDFYSKALDEIPFETINSILLVTDMENRDTLEKAVIEKFKSYGNSLEEIQQKLKTKIFIDYYGNLIGKNTYRETEAILILKTPNFQYISYVLNYLYYKSDKSTINKEFKIFRNDEIEKIRISLIAGEIYQSAKRIDRDNSRKGKFYIFCNDQDAIDLVKKQFNNIKYQLRTLDVKVNGCEKVKSSRAEKLKVIIESYSQAGIKEIRKVELRKKLGDKEKSNFSKCLKEIKGWLTEKGIKSEYQKLIFTNN